MVVAITADIHVTDKQIEGKPRLPVIMKYLHEMLRSCHLKKIRHIIIAGDFIDQKNGLPLPVYLAIHTWLKTARDTGVTIYWMRGNHETPDKKRPEEITPLHLFEGVCEPIIREKIVHLDDAVLYMLPWFDNLDFIEKAEAFARLALVEKCKTQILIAHVGLNEGRTSMSNIQIPTKVSVKHLHPDLYDIVLLGDYHMHQQVAPNAWYLGAPIPHTFGDEGCRGVWALDLDVISLELLPIVFQPPQFCRWTVVEEDGLVLDGYRGEDYNMIHVAPHLYERAKLRYPDATVRMSDTGEVVVDLSTSRLSRADVLDPSKTVPRYVELTVADERTRKRYTAEGLSIVQEATCAQ